MEIKLRPLGLRFSLVSEKSAIDPHARDLQTRLELPVPELSDLLGPTPQSSDDTRIADLTTAHHHFIPIKHRSYPNTVDYYLDSTSTPPTTASPRPRVPRQSS